MAQGLSFLCFIYFFSPPIYSFAFSVADVPAIVILLSFAVLIIRFSAVRRRIEGQLLQARDELQIEVVERTQQASLLNLTHDAILVRDMSATVTYWNRGAEEMYGWTTDEASGKVSHRLLKTVFPIPIEQIEAKLMGAGRWEGGDILERSSEMALIRESGNQSHFVEWTLATGKVTAGEFNAKPTHFLPDRAVEKSAKFPSLVDRMNIDRRRQFS